MIPLQYIRTNIKEVKEMLKRRKSDFDLKGFLIVDKDLKENQIKLDELLARRNILSKERTPEAIARGKKIKQDIIDLTEIVDKLTKMRDELWAFIPNFLDPRVPDGDSDADNVEMKKVGVVPKFDFKPKWHDELAQSLDILDIKAGTKVTGSGFFYWKGKGARLVTAVMNFVLDTLEKRGFTQMITPIVAKEHTFFGTGYLPFAEDQLYTVKSDNISLIGTSEQTMVAYHQDVSIDLSKPKL
jgi:seryl-tRNA synthetase